MATVPGPFNPLGSVRDHNPVMSFEQCIARGYAYGHTRFAKNGYNLDVNNLEEDIWTVGGTYVWPTVGQQMEIVSTSAEDAAGLSGIRSVRIEYLDSNFKKQVERVTLNGVGVVTTVATDIFRVNTFRADTVGTAGKAVGTIDIRHLTNTPIYGRILPGYTRGRNSAYCVPDGYELFVTMMTYSSNATAAGHFSRFTFRTTFDEQDDTVGTVFFPFSEIGIQDAAATFPYPIPMRFPEHTCMIVSVIGDAANSGIVAGAQYRGYLVQRHV